MNSFLVDTDWMADFLNGRNEAVQLLSRLMDQGVAISIITYAELCEGISILPDDDRRRSDLETLSANIDVLGIDHEVARVFGRLRSELRRGGQLIPDMDSLIAATALRHDLALISRDRHFERIPDLKRHP